MGRGLGVAVLFGLSVTPMGPGLGVAVLVGLGGIRAGWTGEVAVLFDLGGNAHLQWLGTAVVFAAGVIAPWACGRTAGAALRDLRAPSAGSGPRGGTATTSQPLRTLFGADAGRGRA